MTDTPEPEQPTASTALVREKAISTAIQKVADSAISWNDLLDMVTRPPDLPAKIPDPALPSPITEIQQKALDRLPEVYGKVLPTERRKVTDDEAAALMEERTVLTVLDKMAKSRIDDIRKIVFNALDTLIEETIPEGQRPPRDEKGYYVAEGVVVDPTTRLAHKREVRKGSATISTDRLEKICNGKVEGVEIPEVSHADYLACTTQVRVFSPEKALLHAKKNPAIIRAIAEATQRGPDVNAFAPPRKV